MNDRFIMTKSEYDVVVKIAKKSNFDCWFIIETDNEGYDYVRDPENGKAMTLREGLKDLVDGLTEVNIQSLTPDEIITFLQLLGALL